MGFNDPLGTENRPIDSRQHDEKRPRHLDNGKRMRPHVRPRHAAGQREMLKKRPGRRAFALDLRIIGAREDNGVYVTDEVNRPILALPKRSGRLTLSATPPQPGGITPNTADAAQMFMIRGADSRAPTGLHLNARSPVAMVLASRFELAPKDIVYVDGNGLVRFGRVLSLLLPHVNTGVAAGIASK